MLKILSDYGLPRNAFKYDSGGRRISSQLQVEMPYQTAGEHFLLPDGRPWFVEDGTGDRTWPIYLGNRMVATVKQSPGKAPELSFVISDHLGYPEMVINTSGTPTWSADHLPFGQVYQHTGDNDPGLRYLGQWTVPEAEGLGLPEMYYNVFRWYRGGWGRYLQADPVRPRPRRFDGVVLPSENSFSYARLNPMKFFDERGLEAAGVYPADPTEDCNFSRYVNCCSEKGVKKWCCKKIVDFSCRAGAANIACCEQEFSICKTCKAPTDPGFNEHYTRCELYRTACLAGRLKAACP